MSEEHLKRVKLNQIAHDESDWSRFDSKTDAEIEADMRSDPDWASDMEIDWSKATVGLPPRKEAVSIRLDADILEHFRSQGSGYQTRINAVLRHYVDTTRSGGRQVKSRRSRTG